MSKREEVDRVRELHIAQDGVDRALERPAQVALSAAGEFILLALYVALAF
jgi:hypothetical protein